MAHPFSATDQNPDQATMSGEKAHRKSEATGNRCGHDPASPRLVIEVNPYQQDNWNKEQQLDGLGDRRKASWFYEVSDKLNQFFNFPKLIPLLGLIYNGLKSRKHRSEAREADIAVLTALVHRMELASTNWDKGFCRVGRPTADGFLYYDNKYWRDKTGLSESRLKRSFRRLQAIGFVKRERRWTEREGGRFKGLATMTLVNHAFFRTIDMLPGLRKVADFAREKLYKAAEKLETTVGRMLSCPVERRNKQAENKRQAVEKVDPADYPPTDIKHWECRLNDAQKGQFRTYYLGVLADGGVVDAATLYREAYLHATQA